MGTGDACRKRDFERNKLRAPRLSDKNPIRCARKKTRRRGDFFKLQAVHFLLIYPKAVAVNQPDKNRNEH